MKHKLSKGKRIIITAMAVMCALSTAAAIGQMQKPINGRARFLLPPIPVP